MSMETIELYYKKIDRMLAKSDKPKKKGNGLLSPSMSTKTNKDTRDSDQMQTIADIVDAIRQTRKELMNGK